MPVKYIYSFIPAAFKKLVKCLFVLVIFFYSAQSYGQVCTGPVVVDALTAPVIDGIIDGAWTRAPVNAITKTVNGTLQADYAGQWRAMFDNTYLYILIEVKDAALTIDGGNPFDNDGIEIYIDGAHNQSTTYDANDFQLGFELQFPLPQPVLYGIGSTAGILSAMPDVPGGYLLEVAIPWATIGGTATNGRQIGFDININDDDNGGSREATAGWFSNSNQLATNPSLFGTVTLTKCVNPLAVQASHTDPNCGNTSDGTITINGVDGLAPYTYSKDGINFSGTNIFPGLAAGAHTVYVKDDALTVKDTVINLVTAGSTLTVRNDTTICPGSSSVMLSVSGGTDYVWSAYPADPTLIATGTATPTVSPVVTTTYTVTSAALGNNLIANPAFEDGYVGFTSDYVLTSAPTFNAQTYSIDNNPQNHNSFFTTCGDHTTGTGKMMVIDGGLSATARLWCQTVPVLPNNNYVFSYWIQTLAINAVTGDDNPAQLDIKINGTSAGIGVSPVLGLPCGQWVQKSFTWNSGTAVSAQLCFYDLTITAGGNDFAIDDIFFGTGCTVSKAVKVTVSPLTAPTAIATQPTCTVAAGIIEVTSPASGAVYSFDNGNTFQTSSVSPSLPGGFTYNVKVKDAAGCISLPAAIVLNLQPTSIAAPTAIPTQPDCTAATGSITVTAPATGVIYSFDDGISFQAASISPPLAGGVTYQVKVKNAAGCISLATPTVINPAPATAAEPTVTSIQPNCTVATGSITVTLPATGVTYSFDDGISFQFSPTSFPLPAGITYVIKVKNSQGCISPGIPVSIATQPITPAAPATTVEVPTCTLVTGKITVTNAATGITYSFDDGNTFQSSPVSAPLIAGINYLVKVKTEEGCISEATITFVPPPLSSVTTPTVDPVAYCMNDIPVSLAAAVSGTNLKWYSVPAGGTGSDIAPIPVTAVSGITTYFVSQSDGTCESLRAAITVTVNKIPVVYAGGPEVRLLREHSVILNARVEGDNYSILWTPVTGIDNSAAIQPRVSPPSTTTYTITATAAGGCSAADTVNVIIVDDIFIPNIFSPNGDGSHDTWLIKNIEQYPTAHVKIFNRYGQFLFESEGYDKPWDGTYQNKPLPVGAYYYIIQLSDKAKPLAGSVSLIR